MYAGNSVSHIVNVEVLPKPIPTFAFNATDFHIEQPKELKTQFLRWLESDKHHFLCWSPTLTVWEYPLERFGTLN